MNNNNYRTERRDAAENRQRILDTAFRLFEQFGVEKVSMNQIASEAQIGPGTLYRRYRNKGELCMDLMKDNVVLFFEDVETYMEENHSEEPNLRFRGILSLFIRFRENKAQLLKGVEDPSSNRSTKRTQSPLYQDLHQIFLNLFDEVSEEDSKRNIFKTDMLLAALRNDAYSYQREVRGYSPEEILEQLCALFGVK